MNRVINAALVAAALLVFNSNFPILAQSNVFLPTVVVTPERYDSNRSDYGPNVNVITSEEIAQLGVQTLTEALQYLSGATSVESSGLRSVFLRGLASNQTKILVDGIEMKDPISPQGTPFLDGIPLHLVDRIEIVTGSQGPLYGTEAMAGVIQVFTKSQSYTGGHAAVTVGPHQTYSSLDYHLQVDQLTVNVGLNRQLKSNISRLANTTERDESLINSYFVKVGHRHPGLRTSLTFHKNSGHHELDNFFGRVDDPNYVSAFNQYLIHAKTEIDISQRVVTTLSYSRTLLNRSTENRPDIIDSVSTESSKYEGTLTKLEANTKIDLLEGRAFKWTALIGADRRTEAGKFDFQSAFPDTLPRRDQSVHGVFGQLIHSGTLFNAHVGVRQEHLSRDTVYTYSSGISRKMPVANVLAAYNFRTGYRQPTLFEQFSTFGNPNLSAEESTSHEVSLSRPAGPLRLGVVLFHHTIRDRIVFGTTNYVNVSDTTRGRGIDTQATYLGKGLLRFVRIGYTYTNAKAGGARALRIPTHKFSGLVNVVYGRVGTSLSAIYVGRRQDTAGFNSRVTLPSYVVVNLRSSVRISERTQVFGLIKNALNEVYQDVNAYQTDPRGFFIGIEQGL